MRIDFITPFLDSTEEIIKELINIDPERGEIELKATEGIPNVGVLVGITGQVLGRMLLIFDEKIATKLVEMMNGEPIALDSDLAQSTLGEIANMVMGRSITKLYELGFHFEITPPSVIVGTGIKISTLGIETLSVPYTLPFGKMEVNISIKENT
jgi:chemotaxis protein CheX